MSFLSSTELAALVTGSVETADIAPGALSADVDGRALIADGFFRNDEIAKFADGLFADDAASRLKFTDLMFTNAKLATPNGRVVIAIPIDDLTLLTAGGEEVITDFIPGFAGRIESLGFILSGTIATGGTGTIALNLQVAGVDITGGVLTLVAADIVTPAVLGPVVAATAVTHDGAEEFTDAENLSLIHPAGGTAFTAGAGVFIIVLSVAGQA